MRETGPRRKEKEKRIRRWGKQNMYIFVRIAASWVIESARGRFEGSTRNDILPGGVDQA